MVAIERKLQSNLKYSYGLGNPKKFLTIHQTDNFSKGADARAHASLQARLGLVNTSWHWTVDDKVAIQSYTNNVKCWHAGNFKGNSESIGIEICVNSDGNYNKAIDNAAQLAAKILLEEGIPISRMVQHNYWSGKNCPSVIRNKGQWASFVAKVKKYMGSGVSSGISKPVVPTPKKLDVDGKFGELSVKKLQSVLGTPQDGVLSGQNSFSKANHSRLYAVHYGRGGSTAVVALQKKLGVTSDGLMGPATIKALQRKLGVSPVGKFGPETASALQRQLNQGRLWPAKTTSKKASSSKKSSTSKKKSTNAVAREVISGKWGNGQDRINRLRKAGYNPTTIQREVNRIA